MKDAKTMAFANAYGVLAALENLCEIDEEAKEICSKIKKPVALCFDVKNGPCITLEFSTQGCKFVEGDKTCTCKMSFGSPEKFNNLIDNSKPGRPSKNPAQVLKFLLGPFTKLTNILEKYLRASKEDLKDKVFFERSTILTMYVIGGAICAVGNNDKISKLSASAIVDGDILMGIKDKVHVTVHCKNHHLTLTKDTCKKPRAIMEFNSIELANKLFNGEASAIAELCAGNIYMSGMMNMVDNINRILDRVAVYLA